MRILICTIFTIIVAALVYFYVNGNSASLASNGSDDKTIEELREELFQAHRSQDLSNTIVELPETNFVAEPVTIIKQLSEEEEKAIAEAEIQRQADLLEQERIAAEKAVIDAEIESNKPAPPSNARLQLISQALVMATVNHYDEKSGITLLDVVRPQNVVAGQILGIRRHNTGIIGRVKIDRVQSGQAFADPITSSFFGKPVDVKPGDELIVIP